jgi:hypothetical protein
VEIYYGNSNLNFNQEYLINYKNNNLLKIINYSSTSNEQKMSNLLQTIKKITDSNNFIFYGYDYTELIELTSSNTNTHIWTCISRNSDKLSELFFCLVNKTTGKIIQTKFFKQISLKINSSPIYMVGYDEFMYDLETSNAKLFNGMYKIPFENICSNGLDLNQGEVTLLLELDTTNLLNINDYEFQLYGLYKYQINLLREKEDDFLNSNINEITNIVKFTSSSSNDKIYISKIYG